MAHSDAVQGKTYPCLIMPLLIVAYAGSGLKTLSTAIRGAIIAITGTQRREEDDVQPIENSQTPSNRLT